jgi:hypothetical protein
MEYRKEREREREGFLRKLGEQAKEAGRGSSSDRANSLGTLLRQAQLVGGEMLNEIEGRLYVTISKLSLIAEFLNISERVIFDTYSTGYIDDLTDNLILCAILQHARSEVPGLKMFVSGNSRDFGTAESVKALESAGVKYFKAVEPALGWLKEQRRKSQRTTEVTESPSDPDQNPES